MFFIATLSSNIGAPLLPTEQRLAHGASTSQVVQYEASSVLARVHLDKSLESMVGIEIHNRVEPLLIEWERLAKHAKASPFLWPGWIQAWWHAFGEGELQVLAVYDTDRLTGVVPLHRSDGVLRSLTNGDTPLFGFLAANETAVKALSHALFSQEPRRVNLSFLSSRDTSVLSVHAAASAACYRVITESIEAAPYVAIDKDWDEYEKGLRRKFRSELRRRRRRLEEEGRLTLEVFDGTKRLDELLEEGFRIEGLGWKDAHGTSINSSAALRRFYTEVAQWAADCGWLRLAFLRLNGQPLAFDYCLESAKIHYLLKTGYDPAYGKFAPGMIIRHLMLARAFSKGLDTYDFLGAGHSPWKREWTSTQQERLFLHIFAPTALGFLDRTAFTAGRWGLGLAKSIARSSIVGEHRRRQLKRGYEALHARIHN
jgi:CelD/BcsL family acetyltransferase involved in cellulose biosynthesis